MSFLASSMKKRFDCFFVFLPPNIVRLSDIWVRWQGGGGSYAAGDDLLKEFIFPEVEENRREKEKEKKAIKRP
jgi:hypothetical protein